MDLRSKAVLRYACGGKVLITLLVAFGIHPTVLLAQTASATTKTGVGDGRISAFYDWSEQLPDRPGKLLRSEALPPDLGLIDAGEQSRILYTSTDGTTGQGVVAVSGALFLPKTKQPEGGWPVIAWAHGTVGVADICAPSWNSRSYRDTIYLNAWLRKGYAIIATDYQGLGTPGTHPYNQMRSEAYGVLDSIRAAQAAEPRLGTRTVVIGQSQGGGGAFATAAYHATYAPDVALVGAVATGTPYITLKTLMSLRKSDSNKVDPTLAYYFYIALTLGKSDDAGSYFAERAQSLLASARQSCVSALEADVTLAQLTRSDTLRTIALAFAFPRILDVMSYPTLKPDIPVLLGIGELDVDVSPDQQKQLARDSCDAGAKIDFHLYKGADHSGAFTASLPDALAFTERAMAGKPALSNCANLPG